MLTAKITKEQFKELSDGIKEYMELHVLEEGADIYKKCRVKSVNVMGDTITSEVGVGHFFKQLIDISDISQSVCTCEQSRGICEHIAAVFFYFCSYHMWPHTYIVEFKKYERQRAIERKTKKIASTRSSVNAPNSRDTVNEWYHYFGKEYQLISKSAYQGSGRWDVFDVLINFPHMYNEYCTRVEKCCDSWPQDMQQLFVFSSKLYIINQLEVALQDRNVYPGFLKERLGSYIEEIFKSVPDQLESRDLAKYQPFLRRANKDVRELLFKRSTNILDWLYIYQVLWVKLFYHPDAAKQEMRYLENKLQEFEVDSEEYYNVCLCIAHIQLAYDDHNKMWQTMCKSPRLKLEDVFPYLFSFARNDEWNLVSMWLQWMAPKATPYDRGNFEGLCDLWEEAVQDGESSEDYLKILKLWMPASKYIYREHLLRQGHYRQWAELNLVGASLYYEVPADDLRLVAKKEPAALLPLYHRWVMASIAGKNRNSYKDAVKILKKLRALYNKLKMKQEWNKYITTLSERYYRSRALQEEMRKGNLI